MRTKHMLGITLALGTAAFLSGLFNPFVFDNINEILQNPVFTTAHPIISFLTGVVTTPKASFTSFYRPVGDILYFCFYSTFGSNPFPFHSFQLLLHLANTILVFLIFKHFFKKNLAFFLSLIFLLHPINNEAVIYIADTPDTLFPFFGLTAMYLLIKNSSEKLSYKTLSFIFLFSFLSLLTKEIAIVLIASMVIYTVIFSKINIKHILFTMFISVFVYAGMRLFASFHIIGVVNLSLIQETSFANRMLSLPKIIYYYFSAFIFPVNLGIFQDWIVKKITFSDFYLPFMLDIFIFICIIISGIYIYKYSRKIFSLFCFFTAFFLLGFSICMQIIPLDLTVATRWFYVPSIGLLGMIGVILSTFKTNTPTKSLLKRVCIIVYVVILAVFFILTVQRNNLWQDETKLIANDLKNSPESPALNEQYGKILLDKQEPSQAKLYIDKSLVYHPNYSAAFSDLGIVAVDEKNFTLAKNYFWQTIHVPDGQPKIDAYHKLLLIINLNDRNPKYAKTLAQKALIQYPSDENLNSDLAIAEYMLGNKGHALKIIKNLYEVDPNDKLKQLYQLMSEGNTLPILN